MASTIKLKNGSGAPTAGDLVQGEPALDLTNKRLYTEDAGGTVVEVGTNPTALTIGGTALTATATELNYTDGVTSNIQTQLNTKAPIDDATFTGTTTIPTADINAGTIDDTIIGGTTAAAGTFTTGQFDTSLNVDGTVTADGLTVSGGNTIRLNASSGDDFLTIEQGTADAKISANSTAGNANLQFFTTGVGVVKQRVDIAHNGDISFYEDTGTTAKFYWDASAERLGIGTSSPSRDFHLVGDIEQEGDFFTNGALRPNGARMRFAGYSENLPSGDIGKSFERDFDADDFNLSSTSDGDRNLVKYTAATRDTGGNRLAMYRGSFVARSTSSGSIDVTGFVELESPTITQTVGSMNNLSLTVSLVNNRIRFAFSNTTSNFNTIKLTTSTGAP